MREIKFRAWDGEKMRYLTNMFVGVGQIGFTDEHWVDLSEEDREDVVLMQYTGLKDRNGVEIYEGDILRDVHREPNYQVFPVDNYNDFIYDARECMIIPEESEVIGNIYEDPELEKN